MGACSPAQAAKMQEMLASIKSRDGECGLSSVSVAIRMLAFSVNIAKLTSEAVESAKRLDDVQGNLAMLKSHCAFRLLIAVFPAGHFERLTDAHETLQKSLDSLQTEYAYV